jgi:hypothetical protein
MYVAEEPLWNSSATHITFADVGPIRSSIGARKHHVTSDKNIREKCIRHYL